MGLQFRSSVCFPLKSIKLYFLQNRFNSAVHKSTAPSCQKQALPTLVLVIFYPFPYSVSRIERETAFQLRTMVQHIG